MSDNKKLKRINWLKKRLRIKSKLKLAVHPRLVVFRSNTHIYAQVIDDLKNETIASSSSNDKDMQKEIAKCKSKVDKSALVGKSLAKKLNDKKIDKIIFDRNGYNYHGRVKALAEAVREMNIKF